MNLSPYSTASSSSFDTRFAFVLLACAPLLACSEKGTDARDGGDGAACVDCATKEAGPGSLAELSVTSSLDPGLGLVPSFDPTIHDYYVQCPGHPPSVATTLTVFARAPSGTNTSISVETPGGARRSIGSTAPEQTLSLSVADSQAIVVTATEASASEEYWVRCLPDDFPKMRWASHDAGSARPPGYYLVGNLHAQGGDEGYAMVLDGNGVPVWYFRQPTGLGVCDVDSVVEGAISFVPATSGNGDVALEPFEVHRLDPPSTTYATPSGTQLDEHELRVLPNGHFLVLSDEVMTGVDLAGLDLMLPDGGTQALGASSSIVNCEIDEFDPATGGVVWRWMMTDHFEAALDSTYPEPASGVVAPDGGLVVDPFHCNSIDVDPTNENLLVSARNADSVFYVERPSGRVLWKMGGKAASKDGAIYVSVADAFYRQHDARLQPGWSSTCGGGAGQVSLFDDHTAVAGPARGAVYEVLVGTRDGGTSAGGGCGDGGLPEGGTAGKANLVWQYRGPSNVEVTGSFRISPDRSRVIGWGYETVAQVVFTEVDIGGNDLLDFTFTDGNVSYRAIKVPMSAFDLGTLRETAGLP